VHVTVLEKDASLIREYYAYLCRAFDVLRV
jgi:hypothetical protein